MAEIHVRAAVRADLPQLTEIYNHYVLHTPVTFDRLSDLLWLFLFEETTELTKLLLHVASRLRLLRAGSSCVTRATHLSNASELLLEHASRYAANVGNKLGIRRGAFDLKRYAWSASGGFASGQNSASDLSGSAPGDLPKQTTHGASGGIWLR